MALDLFPFNGDSGTTGAPAASAKSSAKPAPKSLDLTPFNEAPSGVDDGLFAALLHQESGGKQFDRTGKPITSSKGATGIAQVMEATGPEAAALAGLPWDKNRWANDQDYNASIGKAYFSKQLQTFGDPAKALAAYNAGPGAMQRAQSKAQSLGTPDQWLNFMPEETRKYVPSILAMAGKTGSSAAITTPAREPDQYTNIQSVAPEKTGALRTMGDQALALGQGVVGGVKMLSDLAGPDNAVSKTLGGANEALSGMYSKGRTQEMQNRQALIEEADAGESTLDQITTRLSGIAEAPFQTVLQAAGSMAPNIAAAVATGGVSAGPGLVALAARIGLPAALGIGMGVGSVKGQNYEAVYQQARKEGIPEDKAIEMAIKASEYSAQNAPQQALGGAVGALDALTGAERIIGSMARKGAKADLPEGLIKRSVKGSLGEAPPEGVQGAQGQYAQNEALNNAGFATDPWSGVVASGVNDAVVGAMVGGPVGALNTGGAPAAEPKPAPSPLDAAKAQREAELTPVAAAAAAGGALSKAALAGNTGPAADAQFADQWNANAQQATQEQAANAPVADPLIDRVADAKERARAPGVMDALRTSAQFDASKLVNDLAIASSPSTRADQREQALTRIDYALEWAAENAISPISTDIDSITGGAQGNEPANTTRTPSELRAAADRDAALQGQINAAGTTFDKENLQAQAKVNQTRGFGLSIPDQTSAKPTEAGRQQLSNSEQIRLESASLEGKKAAAERPLVSGAPEAAAPGSIVLPIATNTPRFTSQNAANQDAAKEEADRLAAQDRANASGTAGVGKRIVMDAPAKPAAAAPLPSEVMAAMKVTPFQRSAEQKAILNAAKSGYRADQLSLMEQSANGSPALMSAVDKMKLRELEIKRSKARADAVPNTGANIPKPGTAEPVNVAAPIVAATPGEGPAVFRKRKAELTGLIQGGLTTVERRQDGFYLVDGSRRKQYKLQGPADAQLARKAIKDRIDAAANQAATSPLNDRPEPTGPQIDAVNWKKGEPFSYFGQRIVIENPADSIRKSKPGAKTPWQTKMKHHYGDIAGTKGADGDAVDAFIGYGSKIFVVDQVNADGSFDEHKVMMGFDSEAEARAAYLANYEKGWTGLGAITEMAQADFNGWVKSEAATKPLGMVDKKPVQRDGGLRDGFVATDDASPAVGNVTIQVDGQKRTLPLVEPNATEQSASERRPGGARLVSGKNAALVQELAKLMGKKVSYFRDATLGDGFVTPSKPDTIFLNQSSTISPVAVFGHEFLHQLKTAMPEVHAALMRAVDARLKGGSRAAFRADYSKDKSGNDGALNAGELEEITSDIGGNLMADPTFWREVFDQVQKDSPTTSKGTIAQLAERLYKLIDQLVGSFKQGNFKSTELVNDLEGLRSAFKGALAQYIQTQGISQAAMQAEIVKAGQKARRSAKRNPDGGSTRTLATSELPEDMQVLLMQLMEDNGGPIALPKTFSAKMMDLERFPDASLADGVADERGEDYARQMIGESFPPVILVGDKWVDGRHRVWAARKSGAKDIETIDLGGLIDFVGTSIGQIKASTARNQTETEAFKKWFGDSKVVDEKGRPLIAYHGSTSDIAEFDTQPDGEIGAWFTAPAKRYGDAMAIEDAQSAAEQFAYSQADIDGGNEVIYTAHLAIEKPKVFRSYAAYKKWSDASADGKKLRAMLMAEGHDGVVIRNSKTDSGELRDDWVAIFPHQIKSAIGNNGQFDGAKADITKSPGRATSTDNRRDDDNAQQVVEPGRIAAGAGAGDAAPPRYGRAIPGSTAATGVHFGAAARKGLSSSFYGTGLKGAEAERLAGRENTDIRPRVFYYVDTGQGVRPEAGVGGSAHQTELKNLYDVRKDPLGLVKNNSGANNWERAIMKAGFDGYLNNDPRSNQGFAVLVGKHDNVPVKNIPKPGFTETPPAQDAIKKGLMSKELAAIEIGNIPNASIKNGALVVPESSRDAANDEMMRIGSPVRFSPARAADSSQAEYDAVVKQFKGTDEWLKAPNGKDSLLKERQWVHVRTPSFKKWFGDWPSFADKPGGVWNDDKGEVSKAVDVNGEPMVVYHGANRGGFAEFNTPGGTKRGDLGIFAADKWTTASSYVTKGRYVDQIGKAVVDGYEDGETPLTPGVYALFMNIRNPNESNFEGAHWNGERIGQFEVRDEEGDNIYPPDGSAFMDQDTAQALADDIEGATIESAADHYETTDSVVRDARRGDNDGAIIRQVVDDGPGNGNFDAADVFVALDPNQLKSADFNSGAYSLSKDDIRLSKARDQTDTPEFKAWFGESKVVDAQGLPMIVYHGSTAGGITSSTVQNSFFTPDKVAATTYAMDLSASRSEGVSVVNAVYLKITNPLIVDAGGSEWMSIPFEGGKETTDGLAYTAKRRGHDGVLIKNVIDNVNDEELPPIDVYVTLGKAAQIKSAANNNGDFNPSNNNITQSKARDSQPDDKAKKRAMGDLRKRLKVLESLRNCLG